MKLARGHCINKEMRKEEEVEEGRGLGEVVAKDGTLAIEWTLYYIPRFFFS